MRFGPAPTLTYMGMVIDTMPRYMTVVVFVVISTAVNDFASDAISPWIQNTVMDHKSRTIPYSKFTILFICQTWSLYCGVMSVASIALVFAQFDLIMIRLVVDLFVNQYTIRRFLLQKSHDPFRYHNEFMGEDESDCLAPDDIDLRDHTRSHGGANSGDFVIETDDEQALHDRMYGPSSHEELNGVATAAAAYAPVAGVGTNTKLDVTGDGLSVLASTKRSRTHHTTQ
jgi:hypothetical protein